MKWPSYYTCTMLQSGRTQHLNVSKNPKRQHNVCHCFCSKKNESKLTEMKWGVGRITPIAYYNNRMSVSRTFIHVKPPWKLASTPSHGLAWDGVAWWKNSTNPKILKKNTKYTEFCFLCRIYIFKKKKIFSSTHNHQRKPNIVGGKVAPSIQCLGAKKCWVLGSVSYTQVRMFY